MNRLRFNLPAVSPLYPVGTPDNSPASFNAWCKSAPPRVPPGRLNGRPIIRRSNESQGMPRARFPGSNLHRQPSRRDGGPFGIDPGVANAAPLSAVPAGQIPCLCPMRRKYECSITIRRVVASNPTRLSTGRDRRCPGGADTSLTRCICGAMADTSKAPTRHCFSWTRRLACSARKRSPTLRHK
jgi:hypothetical protein